MASLVPWGLSRHLQSLSPTRDLCTKASTSLQHRLHPIPDSRYPHVPSSQGPQPERSLAQNPSCETRSAVKH